jgi:hypothetical protein
VSADDLEHAGSGQSRPSDDDLIALALETGADAFPSGDRDLTGFADPPVDLPVDTAIPSEARRWEASADRDLLGAPLPPSTRRQQRLPATRTKGGRGGVERRTVRPCPPSP